MAKNNIKVVSITFDAIPFRKLKNLTVQFAERLTLIAGHNGIGKSTILALTTNNFGWPRNAAFKSYFDDEFYCNIEQMMHIDVSEVDAAQEAKAPPPRVTCKVNSVTVIKECSLTRRSKYQRARVVPRTEGKKPIDADGLIIRPDAKIPLPTIHLGIKRILPAGEVPEEDVSSKADDSMHEDDSKLIAEFINAVVIGGSATQRGITSQSIKGARKVSKQPGYKHDPRAISLGQDSLGSIATALASFNRIMREMKDDYPGGLLIIDELDAGLHPHAIGHLATALKSTAKKLNIQIIATTHSPRLIEAIHPDGDGNAHAPDTVVYLHDTRHPRLAPDQSLHAILADMNLRPLQERPAEKPRIPIYFEDDEAAQFFGALLSPALRGSIARKHYVALDLLPLGLPGSNLLKLPKRDPHFIDTVLVVDADTSLPGKKEDRANMVKLPGAPDETGKGMSPERTVKSFLIELAESETEQAQTLLHGLKIANPSSDLIRNHLLSDAPDGTDREQNKKWWIKHWSDLQSWGVIAAWAKAYPDRVAKLKQDTESAVAHVAKRWNDRLAK